MLYLGSSENLARTSSEKDKTPKAHEAMLGIALKAGGIV
jgi:hypothetical protein